jgi:hypothetical protein
MQEILEKLQRNLKPISVDVDIVYEDNIYYITMDGKKTYKDHTEWIANWTNGITGFGKSFLNLEGITVQESAEVSPGVAKFTIGSIFDLLKQ